MTGRKVFVLLEHEPHAEIEVCAIGVYPTMEAAEAARTARAAEVKAERAGVTIWADPTLDEDDDAADWDVDLLIEPVTFFGGGE